MNKMQQQVLEFHRKFDCPVGLTPQLLSPDAALRRTRCKIEEVAEFIEGCSKNDIEKAVDSLVDLLYFTFGAAVEMGVDLEPIFDEVHRANMTKHSNKDAGGKITKPEGWVPPDVMGEISKQITVVDQLERRA